MNWLLVALVCIVAIGAPRHPEHFTMHFATVAERETPKEHAECVHDQIAKQLSAEMCTGAVPM